jgi:hypothetical protein
VIGPLTSTVGPRQQAAVQAEFERTAFLCPAFLLEIIQRNIYSKFKEKNMKRNMAIQMTAGLFLILFCCAWGLAQDVRYNFVPGTDFSKYKTYKWVAVENGAHPDQMVDGQIKQVIDSQLVLKGLTKTDDEKADLYIAYQAAVNQEKQWNSYSTGMGPGYRWGGMGTTTATSSTINIGTIVLDMYDTAAKKQVWRGDATKTLSGEKDPQKRQKNLEKAIAKLLKNYPPPVKK